MLTRELLRFDAIIIWVEQGPTHGNVELPETIFEGLESAPDAFIGLFSGANNGKMLVHLAD